MGCHAKMIEIKWNTWPHELVLAFANRLNGGYCTCSSLRAIFGYPALWRHTCTRASGQTWTQSWTVHVTSNEKSSLKKTSVSRVVKRKTGTSCGIKRNALLHPFLTLLCRVTQQHSTFSTSSVTIPFRCLFSIESPQLSLSCTCIACFSPFLATLLALGF